MKQALFALIVFVLVVLAGMVLLPVGMSTQQRILGCTLEAKICPDGSAVGRTGPHCEFSPCPISAATSSPIKIDRSQSGVRGTITLGPTCPVQRIPPDPACADKPYQTLVAIYKSIDPVHAVMRTRSGVDGTFSAMLAPGVYIVQAGEHVLLPRCNQVQFTIEPKAYTSVAVSCDTGIR